MKNQNERVEREKLYYALRAKDPSDEYLNLMIGAMQCDDDSVSYLASKLLVKDIKQQEDKCALNRASSPGAASDLLLHFLQISAQNPVERYCELLACVLSVLAQTQAEFPELQQFCEQASQQGGAHLTFLACLFAELCKFHLCPKVIDCAPFLVAQLAENLPKVAHASPETFAEENQQIQEILKQISFHALALSHYLYHTISSDLNQDNYSAQVHKYKESLGLIVWALKELAKAGKYKQANDICQEILEIYGVAPNLGKENFEEFKSLAIMQDISDDLRCTFITVLADIFINVQELYNKYGKSMLQYFEAHFTPWLMQNEIQQAQSFNNRTSIRPENVEEETLKDNIFNLLDCISRSIGMEKSCKLIVSYMEDQQLEKQLVGLTFLKYFIQQRGSQINHDRQKKLYKQYKTMLQQAFPDNYIPSSNINEVYYRQQIIEGVEQISEHFQSFISKDQEYIIKVLLCVYKNEEHYLLKQEAIYQLGDIIQFFSNETFIKYKENILQIFREQLGTSVMQTQTEVIGLYEVCMEVTTKFEQIALVHEFAPQILAKFKQIIDGLIQQPNYVFTHDAIQYVEAILSSIESSMRKVPKEFESMSAEICQAFLLVLKQSCNNNQPKLIESTIECLTDIILQHESLQSFIGEIYNIMKSLLQLDLLQYKSSPMEESEVNINTDLLDTSVQVLQSISYMVIKFPQQFVNEAENLIQLLENYDYMRTDQLFSLYMCKSSIAMVFVNNQEKYIAYIAKIMGEQNKQLEDIKQYDLEELETYMNNIGCIATSYCAYIQKFNDANAQQTICQPLLNQIAIIYTGMKNIYIETVNEIMQDEKNDMDQQELLDNTLESYENCLDAIYNTLNEFVEKLNTKMDQPTLTGILNIITELMKVGIESEGAQLTTIVGLDVLNDIGEYCSNDVINFVFTQNTLDNIKQLMMQSEDDIFDHLELIFSSCQCLTTYLKKTKNVQVASDSQILTQAVKLLKQCTDGDKQSDQVIDQVCCYLAISGSVCDQATNYWQNLANYAIKMTTDAELIQEVLVVYMDLLQKQKLDGALYYDLVLTLFFGEHYEKIHGQTAFKDMAQYIVRLQSSCQDIITRLSTTPGIHQYNIGLFQTHLQELNQQ